MPTSANQSFPIMAPDLPLDEVTGDIMTEVMRNEEVASLTRANESFSRFFQTIVAFARQDSGAYINTKALQRADTLNRDIQLLNTSLITVKDMEVMADTLTRRLNMSSDFNRMLEYIKTDDNMSAIWDQLMTMMRLMENDDEQ